jgi:cardiolipin synthase
MRLDQIGSASGGSRPAATSRRWLQPRVSEEQLYRLSPGPDKPRRLGQADYWDRLRLLIRHWGIWTGVAIACLATDNWVPAAVIGFVAFVFYHTKPHFHPAAYPIETTFGADSPEFLSTLEGATGTPFIPGNTITIYNNGDEFFPAMLEAIEKAKRSITMEQYIFWDGAVGRRFAEALAEKAREGVAVKLLVDAIGSATIGEVILRILEAGGCQLAWYQPVRWYTLHRANNRNHRKSLIIDGKIAFTGGAGIADQWLGHATDYNEWRDMMVRVRGPAALAQQSGFAQNWLITTGEIITGPGFFPEPAEEGCAHVQTILSSPTGGAGAAATMYLLGLQSARKSIQIANPYFVPTPSIIELLEKAVQRGVRIELMLAGEHNDTWWARHNSVRLYGKLLRAGVEIYEFEPTMLHHKTMEVDGVWCTIGTTNFDNRSFSLNEETNLSIVDPVIVKSLQRIFEEDRERCVTITLESWRRRGFLKRIQELTASLIEDQV